MSLCIAISHLLNLIDPLADGQREFAIDQINEAHLGATSSLARLGVNEFLRGAGHVAPVGLAESGKPGLVPSCRGVVQGLVAVVANFPGPVERLVESTDRIGVL